MNSAYNDRWKGLKASARVRLETRDYSKASLPERLATVGVGGGEAVAGKGDLSNVWIPGVEIFSRRVFQQKGRGYFAELGRLNEGLLHQIGIEPKQWASALMHRDSAKGFHIHPPYIPEGVDAADWFQRLFVEMPEDFSQRPYDREQWDVMFFLTGICEIILTDERDGMPNRTMRISISGDSLPGPDNVAVVIPPGVAHALRSTGQQDLIMVYGTTTSFNPDWEGRIESGVENAPLPSDWTSYLESR
jgi:dTDP-4-dehydrorhamnose 3,5-epimerase-like enzyme